MEMIVNHIGGLASLIGSLTVVGGALIWVYNKFIGAPREERREHKQKELQLQMIKLITQENDPLVKTLNELSMMLEDSQKDREKLNEIAKVNTGIIKGNTDKINELDDRVIVLETHAGVRYKKGGD